MKRYEVARDPVRIKDQRGLGERGGGRTSDEELGDLELGETLLEELREGELHGSKGVVRVHEGVDRRVEDDLRALRG